MTIRVAVRSLIVIWSLAVSFVLASCGLFPKEDDPAVITLPEPPGIGTGVTYPVERLDLLLEIKASAIATPVNRVELYFTQPGRLTTLTAGPTAEVEKDQILAKLETTAIDYQLEQAEIDMQILQLRNRLAQIQGIGNIQGQIQELEIRKQESHIDHIRSKISGATIQTPIGGVVERVYFEIGDEVPEYETVAEILDPDVLALQVRVSPLDFDQIFSGLPAFIQVEQDDWREGVVVQTTHRSPSNDPTVSRDIYLAHVELLDPENVTLRMNSRLSARIVLDERKDTLAIPIGGLREFKDQSYVRLLEGEVRREVYIKTGIRTETRVEVLDGLEEGMLVLGR